jgi:hypothetical protein
MTTNNVVALRPEDYELQFYDSGCRAIEQATRIDEVKTIADKSVAVATYARLSRNLKLEADSKVIRNRAQAKMGKLMLAMRRDGTMASRGYQRNVRDVNITQAIEDIGISRGEAARAVRLAGIPESDLNVRLERMRRAIIDRTASGSDRMIDPPAARRDPPSIDRVVSNTWRFWDRIKNGDEMKKLKEIAANKQHAQRAGIDHLKGSLDKVIVELNKISRRLS